MITSANRRILLSVLCLLALFALATSAYAEEPKGFLTWPWGTTKETMFKEEESWCQSREKEAEVGTTIKCHLYRVGDIYIDLVTLDFLPNETVAGDSNYLNYKLAGYSMVFAAKSYADMRGAVVEKFGPPKSTSTRQYRSCVGQTISAEELEWRWPSGTRVSLMEACNTLNFSCLSVLSKPLFDSLQKAGEEKAKERKKAF
jgi:hypothetical protein